MTPASSSTICAASSRVGARISADGQAPLESIRSASGTPKASVLPEPVGDLTSTSWPSRTSGTTIDWTANGVSMPRLESAEATASDTPSSAKVEDIGELLLAAVWGGPRHAGGEIRLTPSAPSERLQGTRTSRAASRHPDTQRSNVAIQGTLSSRHDRDPTAYRAAPMNTLAEPTNPGIDDDVEPCEHETTHRIITGTVTVVPVLCLLIVAWQVWGDWLGWNDIFVFLIMYVLTALGVTVGFHRLFTHRSFKTSPFMRGVFAVLGSAAIEGPVISWVADHRKHHAFSDRPGDPHSPHVDHGSGWRGALRGLAHAHVGWLFLHTHRGRRTRYAPDLLADPVVRWVDRWFVVFALGGLVLSFVLGIAIGGTLTTGLTGLLWGGAVRLLV